jgi:hypothetical protein
MSAATMRGEVTVLVGVPAAGIRVGRGASNEGLELDLVAMPVPFRRYTGAPSGGASRQRCGVAKRSLAGAPAVAIP